jgi:sialic acid synthase SpsE
MFKIEDRAIDSTSPLYIIVELSANHNGSLDRAKLSIKIAKECEVDG